MDEIVNHIAEEYAKQHTSSLDDVLNEIEVFTLANHPHAQMLSGHVQGKVLEMLSCMIHHGLRELRGGKNFMDRVCFHDSLIEAA